ncbi:MAG: hypothetical protein GF311_10080 [Candidatus Lokiarchaeota archaeon]|nr:hypothetical protein [Candidatus Lokiarchaeota archaeon]
MNGKRDQLVGIRFTEEERELIENFADERNLNLSDFIRESIFSHMYNLKNKGKANMDLGEFINSLKKINQANEIIDLNLEKLKKNLDIIDLKRIEFDFTKIKHSDLKNLEI